MPQLPSGLLVGLSIDPALEKAKEGNFFFRTLFKMKVRSAEDIAEVTSIVYNRPKEDVPYPGEAYLSGMTMSAIGTDRCDWPKEDVAFFQEWLATEQTQEWMRERYNELVEALEASKLDVPESLKGIFGADDDDFPVTPFANGRAEEELPDSVINMIGDLIKRDNVQSVSFPFNNTRVWRLLVNEQLQRAKLTGFSKQKAFTLSGPEGGLACDPTAWGGVVHIPYEGCCMGDLFVKPSWRNLYKDHGEDATLGDYATYWADPKIGQSCHYLLQGEDMGEIGCAVRHVVGDGWFLYESNRPYIKTDVASGLGYRE